MNEYLENLEKQEEAVRGYYSHLQIVIGSIKRAESAEQELIWKKEYKEKAIQEFVAEYGENSMFSITNDEK